MLQKEERKEDVSESSRVGRITVRVRMRIKMCMNL